MSEMEDFEKKNYFELLGVERDASMEEIKQSFKEITLVYHPDSNFFDEIIPEAELPPDDMKLFKAITQAYIVLSNEETRAAYDKTLSRKPVYEGINLTGDWLRPDGSAPQEAKQVRVRNPTITNLQKLQKQYEESVTTQPKSRANVLSFGEISKQIERLKQNISRNERDAKKLLDLNKTKDDLVIETLAAIMDSDNQEQTKKLGILHDNLSGLLKLKKYFIQ